MINVGSTKHSVRANSRILEDNLASQNTMLTAYAMHGLGDEGITLFQHILANGFSPDEVTFLAVHSSCTHAGKVDMCQELEEADPISCYQWDTLLYLG